MAGDPNDCSDRTILLRDIIPEFAIEMAAAAAIFCDRCRAALCCSGSEI